MLVWSLTMRLKRRLVTLTITGILASTLSISPAFADGIPNYPGSAALQTGAENSAVKKMQAALIELGYDIPVSNGKYGPATTRAVSKFYFENGDIDDGTSVGPLGWNEIFIALDEQRAVNKSEKEYEEATKEEVVAQLNPEQVATVIPEEQRGKQPARGASSKTLPYKMPVAGQISAVYNQKGRRWAGRRHDGIDIRAPRGTVIKAVVEGKVTFAGWQKAYGRLIILEHADGTTSWYAHMSKRVAKKGDVLMPGDTIGLVGASGHTTGSHLHFETHNANGEKTNPVTWLQSRVLKVEPATDPAAETPVTESATN